MVQATSDTHTATPQVDPQLLAAIKATLNLKRIPKSIIADLIEDVHAADIADVIEQLPPEQRGLLLPAISTLRLGEVLAELNESVQEQLLETLDPSQVAEAMRELDSDDVADIVQQLPDAARETVLRHTGDQKQRRLTEYDPDTAGGLMQLELVTATPELTVEEMLKLMRTRRDELPDSIGRIFVVGPRRMLLGTISLDQLVQSPLRKKLKNVMNTEVPTINPEMPEREILNIFEKYDLHNVAVVSRQGYLLGRVTIDDVLDVALDAHEKDMLHLSGVDRLGDVFANSKQVARSRFPWLLVNLMTAIAASAVIAAFDEAIAQLVALAVLMPIVASMGGNAGTQTLAVMVRGLGTGQVTVQNATYLLKKELLAGALNGLLLGIGLAIGTALLYQNPALGFVIFLAAIGNHILAAIAGHLIPFIMQRFGKDPAVASGVFLTTVTDVGGFFLFLGLASVVLF